MALKCDVQYGKGSSGFKLTKVGVSGVRKPVLIERADNSPLNRVINCSFDIYVDLPAAQRGSHLSRNVEVLRQVAEETASKPAKSVQDLAVEMVKNLLVKHEYAENVYVNVLGDYYKSTKTPQGRDTLEIYTLIAGANGTRDGQIWKTVGVDAIGMSACPCAQETVGEMLNVENPGFPMMTHNQRNICSIVLTMDQSINVEVDDLIDLAEKSVSSPIYELLKREDEGSVVINAHNNTKFVEDVVRAGLTLVTHNYTDLPDDVDVFVSSDSEESIHKHNAYAERSATLGELREELAQNIKAL